tara:strand:- start:60 stop:191 length:132 start_codon:yes stop_codon:yes gene_type:complete
MLSALDVAIPNGSNISPLFPESVIMAADLEDDSMFGLDGTDVS